METITKSSFGPNGLAEVRVLANKIKVIFEDGDIYELPLEAWDTARKPGNYYIGLNKDRTDIAFLNPPPGRTWTTRFREFKREGAEIPMPYVEPGGMRQKKDGGTFYAESELRAKALLSILEPDGKYDGLTLTVIIPYIFDQSPNNPSATIMYGKKGQIARAERLLRLAGFDFATDQIPYSPNVLPFLETMLKERDRVFTATTNDKGFVTELGELPVGFQVKR